MALIPPNFFNCAAAIGVRNANGYIKWVGTGTLFGRFFGQLSLTEKQYHLFIVTNKHVLANQSSVVVRFNPTDNQLAKDYDIPLIRENGQKRWREHPKMDLAAIGINAEILDSDGVRYDYFRNDKDLMTLEEMEQSGISEGDFIYVLGFPMGIVDMERQYVIARSGIIARLRDTLEKKSLDFLIDASIFPGNSGGPVINKPEIISIQGTQAVTKTALIGVVSDYLSYKDTAVSQQTGNTRIIFEENSGLAVVIPSDYVLEVIEDCFASQSIKENAKPEPVFQ
tara:strand:- start:924 stop:1769 length:846 start_codon:yes stop_codon:yes gene_type:complete